MTSDERILHLTKQLNGECFHATTPRRAVVHAVAEELHVPARAIELYDHVDAVTSEEDLNKPLGDDFLDDAARFQCKVVVAQDNLRPHEFPIASREPTSTTTALLKCSYPDCPTRFSPQTTSLSGEGCCWYRHRCGHLMCGFCQEKRASFADEEHEKHDTIVCPLCCVRTKRFSSVWATVVGAQGNENEEAHEALKAAKGSRFARLEAIMEQTLCKLHEGCRSPAVVCEKPFGIPACQEHFNELQTENRSKKRPVCTSPCSLNASDVLLVHGSCGNQRADLYCHTCEVNVCVYCARVDHGEGHKVTTLASAFEADTGALVGQRWGCTSQWLHNIDHAAHAAEEYQEKVEDEHRRNIETIRTVAAERKAFIVCSFAKERAHIEEMLQELNQKETELLEKDDAHMQEMKNSADAEATKALRDIETYVRQLALLQSELLDSHVGLTQISASVPLQLFLKNNKLTDYVSETRFSSRVEELHVSTWTPVPPTLPPLIRYKPSNKMGEGGFCDVSIGFARSLPAVTASLRAVWRHVCETERINEC